VCCKLARDVVVKREETLNQLVTTIINTIPLFLLIEIIKLVK